MPVPVPVLHYEQYLWSIILCKMLNSQYIMHTEQAKMLIAIYVYHKIYVGKSFKKSSVKTSYTPVQFFLQQNVEKRVGCHMKHIYTVAILCPKS